MVPFLGALPLACVSLLVSVSVTTLASSIPCYGGPFGNNGAVAAQSSHSDSKGLQTSEDLYSATPFDPVTTAIVHPTQIAMDGSGDFVGWGTTKGVGTNDPDAISNCPANLGARWALYVDGFKNTVYFCRQSYGSEPDVASGQVVEIRHTTCNGSTQWAFSWNSSLKTCQTVNGTRGTPNVGGESIGADPQHIDTRYRALKYRVLGGNWTNWTTSSFCVNSGYVVTVNSVTDISPLEVP